MSEERDRSEMWRANNAVAKAKRAGELIPQPCEVCLSNGGRIRPDVVAHHDDYSKPLEVRWLCRMHHITLHQEMRRKAVRDSEATA